MTDPKYSLRPLLPEEITRLEAQGCTATSWTDVIINPELNLSDITQVRFVGAVSICQGAVLRDIPVGIGGCIVRENARIENVAEIIFEPEAMHGVGTLVSVLDETGSRAVPLYPGLSSQAATLMAREPRWLKNHGEISLRDFLDSRVTPPEIGANSLIKNCGTLKNVSVGPEVIIQGASRLENGSIINNAAPGKSFCFIGNGVEAENFIIEDARVESKSLITNCYVGQGAIIAHGFSAHDCLFFANCSLENGEAHSLLAGP